jgi:hypothetical protein
MSYRKTAGRVRSTLFVCAFGTLLLTTSAGTAGAAALPDGRAYELVSPAANKNGADVMPNSQRMRVASDGGAVAFPSLTAFGDVAGTGVSIDYMSVRSADPSPGTNGWATHAITPAQDPLSLNGVVTSDPLYVGDFSPDLNVGLFNAWSSLTDDPSVVEATNLYVRDDLRTPGPGTYRLVSACPLCDLTSTPLPPPANAGVRPVYGGASDDYSHLVWEQGVNLTSDAPSQAAGCAPSFSCRPRAYEWTDGAVRLVGLVPSGSATSCVGSACVAAAASVLGRTLGATAVADLRPVHVISSDGDRIFFTVPTTSVGAVTTGRQLEGRLYMRSGGTRTDEVSASERTDCAGDPTCGGDGVANPAPVAFSPTQYWGAAADGSRVFFTTPRALTDDAPVDGTAKLYMFDATKPASDPHNLTYLNYDQERSGGDTLNGVVAVIGESDDGSYVYFIAFGQLVPGQPLLGDGRGIYLWHDGAVAYIGETVDAEASELMTTGNSYVSDPTQGRVTPDGRHVLISSHDGSDFSIGYDHGSCAGGVGCRELYVYSADTQTLACASCNPSGAPATAPAASGVSVHTSASWTTWHLSRAITDDGARVFFTTGEALVADDSNGSNDAYEYDVATGQVRLISSGKSPSDSYFLDATASGDDVYFATRERLIGWDTDTSYDLYDARVGGGFPDPEQAAPGCLGAACQGPPSPPPGAAPVGSSAFDGAGDLTPILKPHPKAMHCKRGFVKRRVRGKARCVKRRRAHAKRAGKRAGAGHARRAK